MGNSNRLLWVDNLRGISVLAVIFMHSTLAVAGLPGPPGFLSRVSELLNHALLPYRMGLMFFVSGLFVEYGLRKGRRIFYLNKVKSILYPFTLWAVITITLDLMSGRGLTHGQLFGHEIGPPAGPALNLILGQLAGGGGLIWFLYALFVFFLVIPLVRKIPIVIVIPFFLLAAPLVPPIPEDSLFSTFDDTYLNKILYLFPFFYLGDWFIRKGRDILQVSTNKRVLAIACLGLAGSIYLNFHFIALADWAELGRSDWYCMPALGFTALLAVPFFVQAAHHTGVALVHYIGEHSIVFYIIHFFTIRLVVLALTSIGVFDFESWSRLQMDGMLIFLFGCALLVPWIISELRRKGHLDWLFTLKKRRVA